MNAPLQMWMHYGDFYSDQAISVGRIILLFIVNFVALLNLNTKLALISIIVIPFVLVVSIVLFKNVSKSYEAYQEQEATLSTTPAGKPGRCSGGESLFPPAL